MGNEKIKGFLRTFLTGSCKRIVSGFLFWGWLGFILYSSVSPQNPGMADSGESMLFIRMDYLTHFAAYLLLVILYALWKSNSFLRIKGLTLWTGIAGGILLGSMTEVLQIYIPGRAFNEYDILANVAGIVFGIILARMVPVK